MRKRKPRQYRTKKKINKLIYENLDYAARMASKFNKCNIDYNDLRSQAYLGLVEAANTFDFNRKTKTKFSSYAYSVIAFKLIEFISRRGVLTIGHDATRRKVMLGATETLTENELQIRDNNSNYDPIETINYYYSIEELVEDNCLKRQIVNYISNINDFEIKNVMYLFLQDFNFREIASTLRIKKTDVEIIYSGVVDSMKDYFRDIIVEAVEVLN